MPADGTSWATATPGWPVTTIGGDRPRRRGTLLAAAGAGALVLSLCSGMVGAALVLALDEDPAPAPTAQQAAPVIDRASVAGVAAQAAPSVVDISTGEGEGSGVILTADGAILTNNHVVAEARAGFLTVTFNSGKSAKATIVGQDPTGDLAVIKAENQTNLTPAKFGNSDALRIGDTVLALGSPLGLQGSVTEGIVSALNRTIDTSSGANSRSGISDAIQTDAAINPGNSGGPLVNLAGEVVGINTAIATASQGLTGSIGLGFAIPSNKAKSAAEQLMKGGKVAHPYLGVQVSDGQNGALISAVVSGSPADKAGLTKGDLVTKINDKAVEDANDLVSAIRSGTVGGQIQLTVRRGEQTLQLTATLTTAAD